MDIVYLNVALDRATKDKLKEKKGDLSWQAYLELIANS